MPERIIAPYERVKIKNKDFTIIGNNCVAAWIYKKIGLPYSTPTVGLFFFSDDYIKFLENFECYIKQPLKFVKASKHPEANLNLNAKRYPIGVLGDDVEIHFLHYRDEHEAANKWTERTKRINLQNLFFIYSDRDGFKEEYLVRYEKLPFENKIFLSSKPRKEHDWIVFIRDYAGEPEVGKFDNREYEKYIDVIKWLNGEKNFLKTLKTPGTQMKTWLDM